MDKRWEWLLPGLRTRSALAGLAVLLCAACSAGPAVDPTADVALDAVAPVEVAGSDAVPDAPGSDTVGPTDGNDAADAADAAIPDVPALDAADVTALVDAPPTADSAADGEIAQPVDADAAAPDVASVDAADASTEPLDAADSDSTACPGGAGCACASDAECGGLACAWSATGQRCVPPCTGNADCGTSAACVPFPQGGTFCAPTVASFCAPCSKDSDCNWSTGSGSCNGGLCSAPCSSAASCPEGATCAAGWCQPDAAACSCSQWAVATGASGACSVTNGHGTCSGARVCAAVGVEAVCLAATPSAEVCDNLDNDCDGFVDNGALCDDGDVCTADACVGGGCTHTALFACGDGFCATGCGETPAMCPGDCQVPVDPCATLKPGACDDGNPCSVDACAPFVGCVHLPASGTCTDGNACTTGDACTGGVCTGVAATCDDGNPCTWDGCAPAGGCTALPLNQVVCGAGTACLAASVCASGICVTGAATPCDDGNPCTSDSCDVNGCAYGANAGACNDGNPCTSGDTCIGGACLGSDTGCNDGNPCTADICLNTAEGCQHFATDGVVCGDPALARVCAAGACGCPSGWLADPGGPCRPLLIGLTLDGIDGPWVFVPTQTDWQVTVPPENAGMGVTVQLPAGAACVVALPDGTTGVAQPDVALAVAIPVGTTEVTLTVGAGGQTRTYTLTVTRAIARQEHVFKPWSPSSYALGISVAFDGDTLASGVDTGSGTQGPGAVNLYSRVGSQWVYKTVLDAAKSPPGASMYFGRSLALDGGILAVGDFPDSSSSTGINPSPVVTSGASLSGAVHIFSQVNGVWTQEAYIKPSDTKANDAFGYLVALQNGRLLVGEWQGHRVYVFERTNGVWSQTADIVSPTPAADSTTVGTSSMFGMTGVASVGDTLAIGSPAHTGGGAVYLYKRVGAAWQYASMVPVPVGASGFGRQVHLEATRLLVTDSAALYTFFLVNGAWVLQDTYSPVVPLSSQDGFGIALTVDGPMAVVTAYHERGTATGINGDATNVLPNTGSYTRGAAYLLHWSGSEWVQKAYVKPTPNNAQDFGFQAVLAKNVLAIGAPDQVSSGWGIDPDGIFPVGVSGYGNGTVYLFGVAAP